MKKRVCLFAHFDASNQIKPYILHHLKELRKISDDLVFISTSSISDKDEKLLNLFVNSIQIIENYGYDFAMWQKIIVSYNFSGTDELILTNSSVIGPVNNLNNLFESIDGNPADICAITDNHELIWHLQSYFLIFKKRVLNDSAFTLFWTNLIPYKSKWQTILSYEIGLSTFFKEHDFILNAIYPSKSIIPIPSKTLFKRKVIQKLINPTVYAPYELLKAGSPYIKLELFRDNPYNVNIEALKNLAKEVSFNYEFNDLDIERPTIPQLNK